MLAHVVVFFWKTDAPAALLEALPAQINTALSQIACADGVRHGPDLSLRPQNGGGPCAGRDLSEPRRMAVLSRSSGASTPRKGGDRADTGAARHLSDCIRGFDDLTSASTSPSAARDVRDNVRRTLAADLGARCEWAIPIIDGGGALIFCNMSGNGACAVAWPASGGVPGGDGDPARPAQDDRSVNALVARPKAVPFMQGMPGNAIGRIRKAGPPLSVATTFTS